MKKIFFLCTALFVSMVMLFISCDREEINNNGNTDDGNQEDSLLEHYLPDAVVDIDGNSYDAVRIGDQVWMAENLRTTRYADGTTIPLGSLTSASIICRYTPGNSQNSEDNEVNVDRYGYLYSWPAVMHGDSSSSAVPSGVQGICPTGWHVPSDAEWTILTTYLGNQCQYQCDSNRVNIAKSLASTTEWDSSSWPCAIGNDLNSNNATGFSAFPAGGFFYGNPIEWDFRGNHNFGISAFFWCATLYSDKHPINRAFHFSHPNVIRSGDESCVGFSVRCLRD